MTTTIAVIGATGTAGSRVIARLKGRDITVVEISRAHGVDLITGHGLSEALAGVDVVIDVANPISPAGHVDVADHLAPAYRHQVRGCASQGVQRLVVSTVAGIEQPVFHRVPYDLAK